MSTMFEVLRNLLGNEPLPNKVIETRPDSLSSRDIYSREDGLVLYLPPINLQKGAKSNYEIVLHRPTTETLHQIFSLYRTPSLEEAEAKFRILKDKIPVFIEVSKEMCNTNGLQKICDALDKHPSWTLAHLAAHFALHDAFSNTKVSSFLNSTDTDTGMSPLQVAIFSQNLKTVQIMVSANCSLEHLDYDANSVFHYAASTTKDIIAALTQGSPPRCLNGLNKNGHTPLHMACLADNPDCVKALMVAGADVNITASKSINTGQLMQDRVEPSYVGNYLQSNPNTLYLKDMKNGGTPLHWANSRQVVEALIDVNCHINALNFEMKTALHVMVERNRLDCVVALLSREANADLGDKDGNTPLHLAIKGNNPAIIQALIVFGVDLDILNDRGESPRHLITAEQEATILYLLSAVGAKRCTSDTQRCSDGCKYDGKYEGIPPPKPIGQTNRDMLDLLLAVAGMEAASRRPRPSNASGRLLSLDGGGIRGLVLVQMLLELERVLERPIGHCFDWLAGTSTGGILALAIASGKTMKECLCLYFRMKEQAFTGARPYHSDGLEAVLKHTFGTQTTMADIQRPRVMVTGVLADRKPVELHLFRNYASAADVMGVAGRGDTPFEPPAPPHRQLVWQVGRATGAAPTYFRAFGRFLDGGLVANNPTLDALTEMQEHATAMVAKGRPSEAAPATVVVSLGTGMPPVAAVKGIDVFRPESLWDGAKLAMGLSFLGSLIVDQATASEGRVVDRARAWCSSIGVPYFRFCPQMSEEVAMDEKSDDKLVRMLWETKVYMHEHLSVMTELRDILDAGQI